MKILLNKSENSLKASELLMNEDFFASSVHCAYYSCIQLMTHILFNIHKVDEKEFENILKDTKGSSHEILQNEITKEFYNKEFNVKIFKDKFRTIKKLRVISDYKQMNVFKQDSQIARNSAIIINNILKNAYNI